MERISLNVFKIYLKTFLFCSSLKLYVLPDPEIEENVIGLCRERFIGALSELSNIHLSSEGMMTQATSL